MPWKVRKRKCRQGDGDKGKYVVVKVKRGGGTEQSSCHTTKNLAKRGVKARYASEYGESVMKITAGQLRQIIKEELGLLNETVSQTKQDDLLDAMRAIAYDMDDPVWAAEFLRGEVEGFIEELEDMAASRPEGDRLGPAPDKGMDDALRKEIQRSVDTLANEEVFRDASAEDVAMQSLDYVDHPPSLADEAYEIALAAAVKMGIPREGR